MKYIIDVPDKHTDIKVFYTDADMKIIQSMRCEPYTDPDRKAIEDEVWELANYMGRMSLTERDLCFEFPLPQEVTMNLSYQEAKSLFEKWMENENENEIRVGDEVEYECCGEVVKFIVTGVVGSIAYGFKSPCDYDDVGDYSDIDGLHKTGRHFDEVEKLLEKMREEEDK